MSDNILYLSFSVWLISLSIVHSRPTHVFANSKISFCFMANGMPLCVCVCICILIYIHSLLAHTVKNLPAMQEIQVWSLDWENPLEKEWLPTPVFLPGEFHGQRSLVGYSPWDHKQSDTIDQLILIYLYTHIYATSSLSTHLLMGIWVDSISWLL